MTNSPISNTRRARCIDCAAVIPAGKGNPVGITRYVCDGCRQVRKAQEEAWRYRGAILERVNNPEDRWLINAMLSHLVLRIGSKSPVVFQAVADRVGWMDEATYATVCDVAKQETRAIGLDVQVA